MQSSPVMSVSLVAMDPRAVCVRAAERCVTNRFQVWVVDPLVSSQRAERASDF